MWSFCDLQQARVQEVSSTVHHHGVDIVIRNVPLIEMCGCGFLDSVTRHHRIIAEQGRSLCPVSSACNICHKYEVRVCKR